jgi:EpsD family peptidyl-prolyl cis-trans isomerase
VNGEAIATGDIERELNKAGVKKDSAQSQEVANRLLNVLVEQRLLAQQARKDGLEKDPNVIQALQAAERQVLAQAYVEKLTSNVVKAGDTQISDYYNQHVELFSQRRIYRLQEIIIPVSPENATAVKSRLGSGSNLNDLMQWLKSQNIPVRGAQTVKSAEQLPLELLAKLHPLQDGQAITMEGANQVTILALTGSQLQPLSLEQARPAIERYLLVNAKRERAKADLDKLRAAAKIEYLPPYAEVKTSGHVASAPREEPAEQSLIEKALAGLK